MKLIAPVLRTGWQVPIPKAAEDGKPFQQWDGTIFKDQGSPLPSKSSSRRITVYGDGSLFCIKLTRSQVAELLWQVNGIYWDLGNYTNIAWGNATGGQASTFVDCAGLSMDWKYKNYNPSSGEYEWQTVPWWPPTFSIDKLVLTRSDNSQNISPRYENTMVFSPGFAKFLDDGKTFGSFGYASDGIFLNGVLLETFRSENDSDGDTQHDEANNADYTAGYATADAGFQFGPRNPYFAFCWPDTPGAFWSRIIQTGDNDFWFAPTSGIGKWNGGWFYPDSMFYLSVSASAGAASASEGSWRFIDGDNIYVATSTGDAGAGLNFMSGNSGAGTYIDADTSRVTPIKMVLRSGVATGNLFSVLITNENSTGDASASVGLSHAPTVIIGASSWWGYTD